MVKSSTFPLVVGPNHQTFDTKSNYFTNDIGTAEIYFQLKDEQGAAVPLEGISHVWVKAVFVQHPGSTVAASHQVHVNADIVDAGGGTVKFLVPAGFLQPPNGGRAHVLGELSLHYNNGSSATAGRFTFEMTQAFAHQPLPEGMAAYFVQTFSDLHEHVVSTTAKTLGDLSQQVADMSPNLVGPRGLIGPQGPEGRSATLATDIPRDRNAIFGIWYDGNASPTATRILDSIGLEAQVGIDGEIVRNDFDRTALYGRIGKVVNAEGQHMVRIPKVYISHSRPESVPSVIPGYWLRVSMEWFPGAYLPECFIDHESGRELDFIEVGAYEGITVNGRLSSLPDVWPTVSRSIVNFRNDARANNVGGVDGYGLMDIHAWDVIRSLIYVEFATLDTQTLMLGFSGGRNTADDAVTVAEELTNRAIVSNATAAHYREGQPFQIGTGTWNSAVAGTRVITHIIPMGDGNTAIHFDGEPVTTAVGNVVQNRSAKTGTTDNVLASSGTVNANDGRWACKWRDIENPWGSAWNFVDGVNINDHQAWVAKDQRQYASNVFTAPYEPLSYVNSGTGSGTDILDMGHDPDHPGVQFATRQGAPATSVTFLSAGQWHALGARVVHVGGFLTDGRFCGPAAWLLGWGSGGALADGGARHLMR